MTDAAPAIFVAIEGSAFAAMIRQSPFAYMIANVAHILSLMVFFGAVAVMDLRLTGAFAATSPDALLRKARLFIGLGFFGLLASGIVLFSAEASHVVLNPLFKIKAGLIVLGLLNAASFEFFVRPKVKGVAPLTPLPRAARFAGIASIAIWLTVAACGRLIAYF